MRKILHAFALLAALFAASSFAMDGNLNYYGQFGVHKTQSAQTIGHGSFGIGFFLEARGMNSIVEGENIYNNSQHTGTPVDIKSYYGANGFPFLSIGISNYFDFGISLPVYLDALEMNKSSCESSSLDCDTWKTVGGQGDLKMMAKLRAPINELPIDAALFLGMSIATGRYDESGLWVRDLGYLNVKDPSKKAILDNTSVYTNRNNMLNFGAAFTVDFDKIQAQVPLKLHFNYAHRMTLGGDNGGDYPSVQSFATAFEFTPAPFISLFTEYYMDMPASNLWINGEEKEYIVHTVTPGVSFHFNESFDMQIGIQMLAGSDRDYISNLSTKMSEKADGTPNIGYYSAAILPNIMPFIGINGKIFSREPVIEEEEYRNPDTDNDRVCDPWVAEAGRQNEFRNKCFGIDLCPYEPGDKDNNGCPAKKEAYRNPDTDGDGICDPWVSEEGREKEFAQNCKGIDLCPYEAGAKDNNGCPVVEAVSAEPTVIFSANPASIQLGKPATLSWITTDADDVEIEGLGKVQPRGTKVVNPTETTSYTLIATGKGGAKTEAIEVIVETAPAPTAMFNASPETILKGQHATLTWMTTDATEVSIEGIGAVPLKGTRKVSPTETTTYTIIAKGLGGTQTVETADVVVEEPKIEAKVNLKGVNFISGKSELTLDARRVLDGVAEQLVAAPTVKIEIHGHTDNVGSAKSNQDLSERRAKAVVGYLATKGVRASRMKAVGFGQDAPIANNATAEGRELNRRIEMIRVDE